MLLASSLIFTHVDMHTNVCHAVSHYFQWFDTVGSASNRKGMRSAKTPPQTTKVCCWKTSLTSISEKIGLRTQKTKENGSSTDSNSMKTFPNCDVCSLVTQQFNTPVYHIINYHLLHTLPTILATGAQKVPHPFPWEALSLWIDVYW